MDFHCLEELAIYQEFRFGVSVSERWVSLCAKLRDYQPPLKGSFAIEKRRKWELVSAFQKSIRRGDKQIALRLISAMDTMPSEYGYFWRRLCVIACEDVGLGEH
jgi:replication-associated recombination protein RarA